MLIGRCCRCGATPGVPLPIYRLVRDLGPLPGELGLEAGEWIFRQDVPYWAWRINLRQQQSFFDPFLRRQVYYATSPPFRWKYGWETARHNAWWNINGSVGNLSLSNKTFHIPFREKLLPPTSHMAGTDITAITIPGNLLWSAINLGSAGDTTRSTISHYRMWVNGQDITGIVNANIPMAKVATLLERPNNLSGQQIEFTNFGQRITNNLGISTTDTEIEFDLWFYTESTGGNNTLEYWAIAAATNFNALNDIKGWGEVEYGDANINVSPSKRWKLTPSQNNNIFGGQAELILEPQAGWTTVSIGGTQHYMIHNATGNRVILDWGREVVQLIVENKTIPQNFDTWGEMRYVSTSKVDYQPVQNHTDGVWNPQGSTSFQRDGRHRVGNPFYGWWTPVEMFQQVVPEIIGGYPDVITVTKV